VKAPYLAWDSARSHLAATLVFAASLALVVTKAPAWCVVIAFAAAAWRILIATGRLPPFELGRGARFAFGALTAAFVIAVLMSFRTLNGLAAGTALLTLMGALKLVESRTRRDDAIVVGVSLFLLLSAALASQAMWRLPLYLLTVWGAGAAIALIAHAGSTLTARAALRLAAKALAMALPLAAACFLFFPRVAGQFWAFESGASGTTGLSDEMSPGAIDKLVSEYSPVFRVRFLGATPPAEARYWRGPVLNDFDGFTWRRSGGPYNATPIEMRGAAWSYRVTLEPTSRRWIFALESVDASPRADMRLTHDRQLIANVPVNETLTYDATSHAETRALGPLSEAGRRYETRLPTDRNPRARALAQELRARAGSDADYARATLDWFRDNGLTYSLEPEATSLDSVDSVLFDTKLGFCGHFASAYATLMRAAGIPARVVTGYLGGEYNPIGDYWIVRQSDAHAWTEVWLEPTGWTRIDPTSVVAPERLRSGAYDVLPDGQASTGVSIWRNSWMSGLSRMWDGANQWWRENVLEFNLRSQFDFLRALGIESPDWKHLGWAFAGALIAWIAWVSLALRRSVARRRPDRIARAWLRATRKLAKVASARTPDEGPLAFAARISVARPDLAPQVNEIAARYAKLRFGPDPAPGEIERLEQDVRRLAA
jgi:transglutaminase-like putative cysteine protease